MPVLKSLWVNKSTVKMIKPWPNASIFHLILLSTFDLKVERSRARIAK